MSSPQWVIDTNVLVSAALTCGGTCDQVVRGAVEGKIRLAWSAPILTEYREVLLRPKFNLSPPAVSALLAAFSSRDQVIPVKAPSLPDPDDGIFLGTALATSSMILVTGNTAHFPADRCHPVRILNPAEALRVLERMT